MKKFKLFVVALLVSTTNIANSYARDADVELNLEALTIKHIVPQKSYSKIKDTGNKQISHKNIPQGNESVNITRDDKPVKIMAPLPENEKILVKEIVQKPEKNDQMIAPPQISAPQIMPAPQVIPVQTQKNDDKKISETEKNIPVTPDVKPIVETDKITAPQPLLLPKLIKDDPKKTLESPEKAGQSNNVSKNTAQPSDNVQPSNIQLDLPPMPPISNSDQNAVMNQKTPVPITSAPVTVKQIPQEIKKEIVNQPEPIEQKNFLSNIKNMFGKNIDEKNTEKDATKLVDIPAPVPVIPANPSVTSETKTGQAMTLPQMDQKNIKKEAEAKEMVEPLPPLLPPIPDVEKNKDNKTVRIPENLGNNPASGNQNIIDRANDNSAPNGNFMPVAPNSNFAPAPVNNKIVNIESKNDNYGKPLENIPAPTMSAQAGEKNLQVASLDAKNVASKNSANVIAPQKNILLFNTVSVALDATQQDTLNKIIAAMKNNTNKYNLISYASAPSVNGEDRKIALQRLVAVRKFFIDSGIKAENIQVQAAGNENGRGQDEIVITSVN